MVFRPLALAVSILNIVACLLAHGQDSYPLEIRLNAPVGTYDVPRWQRDWPGCKFEDGVSEGRISILDASKRKWMRVTCQANEIGPAKGGIGWRKPIPPKDRLELAYWVTFSRDFEFVKGGKLPGLCGGPESVTGGNPANGENGFSARIMWRADGRGEAYLYHVGQPNKFGESLPFSDDFRFPRGQPFRIIMRIDMNEIGEADGTFEAWVQQGEENPLKVVYRDGLRWRTKETVQIDSLLCEVFHGGNDASWAPKKPCTVDLAEFLLLE